MKNTSLILFAICLTLVGVLSSAEFKTGEVTGAGEIAKRDVASKKLIQEELDTKVSEIVSFNVSKNFKNHKEDFAAKTATY